MAYITYEEYQDLGGTISEDKFNILERKARRKLDYFTQDRLKVVETIIDEVKELMTEFIDKLSNIPLNGNITSYSNGIESFGFGENQISALNTELYDLAIEYLPIEYISSYVPTIAELEEESETDV